MKPYYETPLGKLYHGDCLEIMPELEPVDLVLTDPPYGTTACSWDAVIPLDKMWSCLNKTIKPNTPVVLTASQPFTSMLIMSNIEMFRQTLVWKKNKPMNFMNANKMFMKWTEDICIFYNLLPTFNPKKTKGRFHKNGNKQSCGNITQYSKGTQRTITMSSSYFPSNIIEIAVEHSTEHPTEKPVQLMIYLIETYTNKGDTVLDFTMGSGTTAIACERLKRKWIGIEIEEKYCEIAAKRIEAERKQLKLF